MCCSFKHMKKFVLSKIYFKRLFLAKILKQSIFFCLIFVSCFHKVKGQNIPEKPNVILINTDDQGYGDLSVNGSPTIKTPNIDKLAKEGMRLTSFYAAGPVCIPSRRGLMTGRYSTRIVMEGNETEKGDMSAKEITLAELFKANGYATAILGKWHLGMAKGSHPLDQGFDYFYGTPSSNDHFSQNGFKYTYDWFKKAKSKHFNVPLYQQHDTVEIPAQQQLYTQRYTQEAIRWIQEHKTKPFFLYLAHNMPHVPVFASPEFTGKSYGGKYGDVIEELDWSVGQIRKTLHENDLDKSTLIIYTSDNGPWEIYHELGGSPGPFRNGKGTGWEGAFRVPAIFWWPEKISPSIMMEPASQLDLFATFSALLNDSLSTDRNYDSMNLLPTLLNEKSSPRKLFAYYIFIEGVKTNELWAVRKGNYKLHVKTVDEHRGIPVIHDPPLLFDLTNDPGETNNIAGDHPEKVSELLLLFEKMKKENLGLNKG